MDKKITTDYLVALNYAIDGYSIKKMGNDLVGVYWTIADGRKLKRNIGKDTRNGKRTNKRTSVGR